MLGDQPPWMVVLLGGGNERPSPCRRLDVGNTPVTVEEGEDDLGSGKRRCGRRQSREIQVVGFEKEIQRSVHLGVKFEGKSFRLVYCFLPEAW